MKRCFEFECVCVCVCVSNEKKMDRVLQDHLGGMESVVEKQILGNILKQ